MNSLILAALKLQLNPARGLIPGTVIMNKHNTPGDTKERIEKKLRGTTAFALNLGDGMKERIIQNAREKIATLEVSKEKIFPEYTEKKDFFEAAQKEYLEIKSQVDNIDDEIKKQNVLIDTFVHYNKSKDPDKRLQLNGHKPEINGTKAAKRIAWINEAVTVLEDENKFMSAEEIFSKVLSKSHVQECLKLMKSSKNPASIRGTTIDSYIEHSIKTAKGTYGGTFKPRLTTYKDLIGLVQWTDGDNVPLAQFMVTFMHGSHVNGSKLNGVGARELVEV